MLCTVVTSSLSPKREQLLPQLIHTELKLPLKLELQSFKGILRANTQFNEDIISPLLPSCNRFLTVSIMLQTIFLTVFLLGTQRLDPGNPIVGCHVCLRWQLFCGWTFTLFSEHSK